MTPVDRQRVETRLAFVREQVASLRDVTTQRDLEEFLLDPWAVRGVKYALQTAIEALIDVCYHLSAKGFAYAPKDARDAVAFLARQGVFSSEEAATLEGMIGFRNRLVHGYVTVDNRKVWELAKERSRDLERLALAVAERVLAAGGPGS